MGGAVELVAGGEVRVGDARFPGEVLPDGRVVVLGVVLRRLGLAERDRLVRLVAGLVPGPDDARTLAGLVLAAASAPGRPLPAGGPSRAAVEAVALHLAGAALDGSLARTRLLAARSAGAAADDLPAADADALAAGLADAVVDDDGWTRLVLDGAVERGGTPGDVRDRLAGALLARAAEPLEPALARALLLAPGADVPDDAAGTGGWGTGPSTSADDAWSHASAAHRWSGGAPTGVPAVHDDPGGARRAPGSDGVDGAGSGAPGWSAAAATGPLQPSPAGWPDDAAPGRDAQHPAGPAPGPRTAPATAPGPAAGHGPAGTPGSSAVAAGPGAARAVPGPPAATRPAARASGVTPSAARPSPSPGVDRWGAPVPVVLRGRAGAGVPPRAGPHGTTRVAASRSAVPGGRPGARPVPSGTHAPVDEPTAPPPGGTVADRGATRWRATTRPTACDAPGTTPDAEALAAALHRAADLRGLRR